MNRNNFGHRRHNPQKPQNSTPLTNRTNIDYRNSTCHDYKVNFQAETNLNYNRYSFDTDIQSHLPTKRQEMQSPQKLNSYDNIRNTLSELKKKLQTAKQKLQGNSILGKNMILEEPENQSSRTFELISFNSSSGSNNTPSLDQTKRSFLEQLRKSDLCQSQIKGYYKGEIVKSIKENNEAILHHITSNWRVLRSCGGLSQPSQEDIQRKKGNSGKQKQIKRTIIFGLDGTLVHVDWQKKSQQDIDVVLQLQDNEKKPAYLCLRPYVMTFLKKMSKNFDIIVFSDRSKAQTDAILQILDPFKEIIKTCLSRQNCIQIKRGLTTKDLRVLDRELSQILLVDNQPYNYLYQIDNAVPILPFHRGNDDQLYSLQKYLLEAARTPDLRKYNKNYFKLSRYSQFNDVLMAIKNLYILQK